MDRAKVNFKLFADKEVVLADIIQNRDAFIIAIPVSYKRVAFFAFGHEFPGLAFFVGHFTWYAVAKRKMEQVFGEFILFLDRKWWFFLPECGTSVAFC